MVERAADVLSVTVKYGCILGCMYCVYLAADALAGRDTFADVGVAFMANMDVSRWAAYLFGVGGVAYGVKERRLRTNTIKRLAPGRIEYEERLDPVRSSSGLAAEGNTPHYH